VKAGLIAAWIVCALLTLSVGGEAASRAKAEAFWAAASAPSSLYSGFNLGGDDTNAPTSWCEGEGRASCEPAAPTAPHQRVSFADAPVAVLTRLVLPRPSQDATRIDLTRTTSPRDGVRLRVERPPQV